MSAAHRVPQVAAFQALCAIDAYESSITALVAHWPDSVRHAQATEDLQQVRRWMPAIPGAAVAWVTVVISHAELLHTLWRRPGDPKWARVHASELLCEHLLALASLQSRCRRQAQTGPFALPPGPGHSATL